VDRPLSRHRHEQLDRRPLGADFGGVVTAIDSARRRFAEAYGQIEHSSVDVADIDLEETLPSIWIL
jgi:hypothetical protein